MKNNNDDSREESNARQVPPTNNISKAKLAQQKRQIWGYESHDSQSLNTPNNPSHMVPTDEFWPRTKRAYTNRQNRERESHVSLSPNTITDITPQTVPVENVISKAKLAQQQRRIREKGFQPTNDTTISKAKLAQQNRRNRERESHASSSNAPTNNTSHTVQVDTTISKAKLAQQNRRNRERESHASSSNAPIDNTSHTVQVDNTISKAKLAQQHRRNRERESHASSSNAPTNNTSHTRPTDVELSRGWFVQPLESSCQHQSSRHRLSQHSNREPDTRHQMWSTMNSTSNLQNTPTHSSICSPRVLAQRSRWEQHRHELENNSQGECHYASQLISDVNSPTVVHNTPTQLIYQPSNTFVGQNSSNNEKDSQICSPRVLAQRKRRARDVSTRSSLGNMDVKCKHCNALHWIGERLAKSSLSNPLFGTCCLQGKIKLPDLITPPTELKDLYDGSTEQSNSFLKHTREYNAANAFTSLGVNMDERVIGGRGPSLFTIHGELRHRTGSLLSKSDDQAKYAQLYIYDPDVALNIRTKRNPNLRLDVLRTIQDCLLRDNVFTDIFKRAFEILSHPSRVSQNIPAHLHYSSATDRRRYNLPTADEVAVVIPGDGTEVSASRDIILHLKGDHGLMRISECHPAYLPLHYVLLFPYGELGWEPDFKQWDVENNKPSDVRLTQLDYFRYRLFQRPIEYSTILRGRKLFQEFLVDAWASTEQNRLNYFRMNQSKLRVELYGDLKSADVDGMSPNQVGKPLILPSSFAGSARNMFEIFQDSMAITRYNQHPDIFLTMTANPKWPEIVSAMLPGQKPIDRPDLVARVFELKRDELMKVIDKDKVFGRKVAHVFTIEFQKRGLPHMHLLLFLAGEDKIRTTAQVDNLVCAEFPNQDDDPLLFDTIRSCMVHGPCGTRNPNSLCMDNGKCSKKYPKVFADTTTMDQVGYPIYRRRDDGHVFKVNGHDLDNRDVVPYNPYLSRMFNCHINVEVCAGIRAVKYIHKYIYKGHDRTTMVLGGDEIQQYLDARYIGPHEAVWRIFGHPLHEEIPNVVRLHLHLPGEHHVIFDPANSMDSILFGAMHEKSTLTAFFDCCATNVNAREYTYQEFPQFFVYDKKLSKWTQRKKGFAIGRMYFAGPNCGEKFYLRLLLTVVKGPRSFEFLRTFNNTLYDTFKLACAARGLLEDDDEWVQCLREASVMKTGYQLRRLFSVILTQCQPLHPYELWKKISNDLCDDLAHKILTSYGISEPTEHDVEDYGLYLINGLLMESGKRLQDFPPMPSSTGSWSSMVGNRLIQEHLQLQREAQHTDVGINVDRLNSAQGRAYNKIMDSVNGNKGKTFFLNGGAGTGKTFLYNTISTKCRSLGNIVINVASSGIASLLLIGGRTAHSTFSIPLNILENSICGFSKQSLQAELMRKTKLIIWDEVPMQHRHCVEAVDRTLQDICENRKAFGGITVVLGGDFRQILPVIPKGVREQIVGASLRRSVLWNKIDVLTLDVNMRLNDSNAGNVDFAKFLLQIGSDPDESIEIPTSIKKCVDLDDLITTTYPNLHTSDTTTSSYLNERTILSARNDDVSDINSAALNIFPGDRVTYLAADKMDEKDQVDRTITSSYPNEYLNSLNPSGLPPFRLELKVGAPIMLLRNIAPKDGLCNGTRLMVVRCSSRVIEARILTGDRSGNLVFIPRISLTPSSSEIPFLMTRRQFPIRLAYAMTINKSQGQSVKFVGIDLRVPVFSHGQLYVALSRCTSYDHISLLLPNDDNQTTSNIVYPEVNLQIKRDRLTVFRSCATNHELDRTIHFIRSKGVNIDVKSEKDLYQLKYPNDWEEILLADWKQENRLAKWDMNHKIVVMNPGFAKYVPVDTITFCRVMRRIHETTDSI